MEEFQSVFEPIDFEMVGGMLKDYIYNGYRLKKAGDLAPEIRPFVISSASTAHKLNELHKQVRDLKDWQLDPVARRMKERQIREQFEAALAEVDEIEKDIAAIEPVYFDQYIQRPVELPETPLDDTMSKYWAFTNHELSRRYPWFYWWRDKYTANGLPTEKQARFYLTLWQLESHLGINPRTFDSVFDVEIEGWNWKPVFVVGP